MRLVGRGVEAMSEVMSVSEASRELHVSEETIREWADRGKLPVMRTSSGQRIFRREDVIRVAADRHVAIEARSAR